MLPGYWQQTFRLGPDPDGEGDLSPRWCAAASRDPSATHAVLLVHGFTDYFFHTELADHFAARGFAFYALDLHKCGRSWRDGQTPHFTTDLARYDTELERALDIIAEAVRRDGPGVRALRGRADRVAVAGPAAQPRRDAAQARDRPGAQQPVAGPAGPGDPAHRRRRARRSRALSRFAQERVVRPPTEGGYGATLHRDYARRLRLRPEMEADRRLSGHVRLAPRHPARRTPNCTAGSTSVCRT